MEPLEAGGLRNLNLDPLITKSFSISIFLKLKDLASESELKSFEKGPIKAKFLIL